MTAGERFERIENILDRVVETQLQVDTTLLTLADSHIKLAEAQTRFTEEMAELKRQFQAYVSSRPQ